MAEPPLPDRFARQPDHADQNEHEQRWRVWLDRLFHDAREERLALIFGDERNAFLGHAWVGKGDRASVGVSVRSIFARALEADARHLILAHNHPSGCSEPSRADIVATRRLGVLARPLGIRVVDHLIVGSGGITSLARRGLL